MSMKKTPKIKMPGVSWGQQPTNKLNVTLNPFNFDQLINSQGIRMVHSRPIPCPNGVRDIRGHDHDPSCSECFNGFRYYAPKCFVGAFMGNNNQRQFTAQGAWDFDTATIIIPEKYDDGTPIDVNFFDQISVPDFSVRYYQRVEHDQSGIDRLHFPAVHVDKLLDANGTEYFIGKDFCVDNGHIRWLTTNRPGWDIGADRGIVYSINYYMKPSFTVISIPHQIRAAQTKDYAGGNNIEARFPQLVTVRRDFIPFDPADGSGSPSSDEPRSGSIGTT